MRSESNLSQEAIFEVIENQIRDSDPPITKETYSRLEHEGHSHDEIMKLIGCAMITEISEIMNSGQTFDQERYTNNLNNLPDLPWEDD